MTRERLVLIPGLLCDRVVWEFQAARLEPLAAPWIAEPSAPPASGATPEAAPSDSLQRMAGAILAAVPGRFSLAGHSLGGRIALEIVRQAPERVARLALLDTGYQARPPGAPGELEAAGRARLVALARSEGMRAMGRQWLPRMVHPDRLGDETWLGGLLDMVERCPRARYEAQIRALLARPDASDVLGLVRCPSLVLCGREDAWSPVEQHREMAERLAASGSSSVASVVLEDCGHMSTVERPEAVTEALRDWLSSAEQRH